MCQDAYPVTAIDEQFPSVRPPRAKVMHAGDVSKFLDVLHNQMAIAQENNAIRITVARCKKKYLFVRWTL